MLRCLYTYAELNQNTPPDKQTASVEHIVPYALGGSDSFVIKYCSTQANNDFGRDIDAPFLALPLVGFKRHSLGIIGHSGKVPDIRFIGDCVELGKTCDVVFPYQAEAYADFGVSVNGSMDVGRIDFSGNADRLRGAIDTLIKKADRRGLSLLTQNLAPIATTQDALSAALVNSGETLHFCIDFGRESFFVPWARGLLKMALGLGAFALGPTWAFSPEADIIRSSLICESSSFPSPGLKGTTTGRLPAELVKMLDVRPGEHMLAVLPHENGMAAYISLFGGELLDAMIDLGNGSAGTRRVNDEIPATWECAFRIDPSTRKMRRMTLAEVNARVGNDKI